MFKNQTKRGRFYAPALYTCLLSFIPFFAAADVEEDESSEEVQTSQHMESVVVTATRTETSLLRIAEAVTVVGAEDIDRKAPDVLAEMLRGMPGAFFQQTTPGQGIPIIRGLKGSEVLHLVDGMRLNNAFFRNAPNQYLGLVDAYATQSTEVVRGAAPSLYGADAMGGVVHVLTQEPEMVGEAWQTEGRFYGTYNSVDNGLIGRLSGATGNETNVLSGGITYQDHGNRETGGGETVVPSGYKVKAADLKWRVALGERSELMLSAQYLEQPSTPRVDELVPGYGEDHPSSELYEFHPNRREFLHARYRLESDSAWFSRFEAHLGRQIITDDRMSRDWASVVTTTESNESTLDGLTLQFNSPWGDNELIWGFEYYADEVDSSRSEFNSETGGSVMVSGRYPDGSTMDSAAVYASNHWQWERLSLNAGLRYSWFDIFLPATDEVEAVQLSPTDLTGDIHLSYEVAQGMYLVSNIGRGFRPPNIFDLGTLGSRPGNRFNIPNPNLKPESVWSYDLGFKASTGRWQLEVFGWYSDYRDKISSRLTGEVTDEGRLVVTSDNLNEAQLYGVESGLRFFPSDLWEYYAVVNYTRGEETVDDMTVAADRIPPLSGRLGMVWMPREDLRFEPYWDFAGPQNRLSPRDELDPRINPNGTPGWGTLNLLASWEMATDLELGLRLQNLGDKNYREHGSGIDAPCRNLGVWVNYAF